MSYTPFLLQRMQQLHAQQPLSGHTPGHKNGVFFPKQLQQLFGDQFASYDYTELPGLDNLHFPEDCIAQSQAQAATIFGAKQCFYLVNGTTAGLQASIMATCTNQKVFVPRHVHRSIYHSLLLAHAQPIYLPLEIDLTTGFPTGISPDTLQQYITKHPDCHRLILVNPTYHGITKNNVACVQLAKQNDLTVIVDEAHGSHLHFHSNLPLSLLDAGADLVVQSWHKTLPVLTQGSALLIHPNYTGMSPEPFLSILQTTSPSYLLMASLEAGSIYMGEHATKHMTLSLNIISALQEKIRNTLHTLTLLWEPMWHQDPFRLYLISDRLTGTQMDAYLRMHHAVYSEMQDTQGILFLLPLQTTEAWADQLYQALFALDQFSLTQPQKISQVSNFYCREIPTCSYSLQETFFLPKQKILWRNAANRISGQFILRYPPGIPLIVPGEIISTEIVKLWLSCGGSEEDTLIVLKS